MRLDGKKVTVLGLGRSGLAVANAAMHLGAATTIYDRSPRDSLLKPDLADEAAAMGAKLVFGFEGTLPSSEQAGDLLVVNPAVDMRSPVLVDAQDKGYELVSEVEFAYRISKAPIVAITGTNGKSTTTVMTYLCLKSCEVDAVLCGNIFGSGYEEVPLTEAALNSSPEQVLVAEISSFQLEWTKEFAPICAGITNIGNDHLDRYDSASQYADTKRRIFLAQTTQDFAVLSDRDYAAWKHLINPAPKVLTYGHQGSQVRFFEDRMEFLEASLPFSDLGIRGRFNWGNAAIALLLAFAALQRTGRSIENFPTCAYDALKDFKGIAHRMELLGEKHGIEVINNSMCTNVDAVRTCLESIAGPVRILMGGKDKELDFAPLRANFDNGVHHAYVYGEAKTKIAEQIGTKLVYETMEAALRAALDDARRGETVMLAPGCASTDQFRDFRDRGDVFRQLAKEWLES